VVTVTGNCHGAGTNANVYIIIFGKTGQTPKLPLRASNVSSKSDGERRNIFERSQSDVFLLKTKCVGPLSKIRYRYYAT